MILISGSSGFVGSHLLRGLTSRGHRCVAVGQGDLSVDDGFLNPLFKSADTLIICSGKAHSKRNFNENHLPEYIEISDKLLAFCKHVLESTAVHKIIFISTTNIYESKGIVSPYSTEVPLDNNSISKLRFEEELRHLCGKSSVSYTIFRCPPIYGRGMKGSLSALLRSLGWLRLSPFGALDRNKISFLSIYNLLDLVAHVLSSSEANNETLIASDNEDVSISEFIRFAAAAKGVRVFMIPIPIWFFKLVGRLLGISQTLSKLYVDSQLDTSYTLRKLAWEPPLSVLESLTRTFERA